MTIYGGALPISSIPEVVSVKRFGARGDGTTNDAPAIIAAMAHLAEIGGGTLYFPFGTYKTNSIIRIAGGVSMVADPGTVILRGHGASIFTNGFGYTGASAIDTYGGNSNITVDGFILDLNLTEFLEDGTHFALGYASDVVVRNCTFLDGYGAHAIDMAECQRVLIEDCAFLGYVLASKDSDTAEAIQLDASIEGSFPYFGLPNFQPNRNITVRRCRFDTNPGSPASGIGPYHTGIGGHQAVYDVWQHDILIDDCDFNGMDYAGVRLYKWKDVVIQRSRFRDCSRNLQCTGVAYNLESAKDVDRVPSNRGQGNVRITVKDNHSAGSLSRAVWILDYAVGDATGSKHETIVISGNKYEGIAATGYGVDMRQCKDVVVEGNTITGCINSILLPSVACDALRFSKNYFSGSSESVIDCVIGCTNMIIEHNTFRSSGGRGVNLAAGVDGVIVAHNIFDGIDKSAIYASNSAINLLFDSNLFRSTNLVTADDQAPIYAGASCSNVRTLDNLNAVSNTTALMPASINTASGYSRLNWTAAPEGLIPAPLGSECTVRVGGQDLKYEKLSNGGGNTGWVGRGAMRVVTAAGVITAQVYDHTIVVNKTTGAATAVTLPAGVLNRTIIIKDGKGDAATNNITITPSAGTIDGAATLVLNTNYARATLIYNGTQWNVI